MEKVCTGCNRKLSLNQFNWKSKARKTLHSRCRSCTKEQSKEANLAQRDYYVAYNVKLKTERGLRYARRVWEYLSEHPCVDCGENDRVVLDFNYIRGNKIADIR